MKNGSFEAMNFEHCNNFVHFMCWWSHWKSETDVLIKVFEEEEEEEEDQGVSKVFDEEDQGEGKEEWEFLKQKEFLSHVFLFILDHI